MKEIPVLFRNLACGDILRYIDEKEPFVTTSDSNTLAPLLTEERFIKPNDVFVVLQIQNLKSRLYNVRLKLLTATGNCCIVTDRTELNNKFKKLVNT